MDDSVKEKLRQHNKARRDGKRLLKDITVTDLQVACDFYEEQGVVHSITTPGECSYLKYATHEQIATLRKRLPHRDALVEIPWAGNMLKPEEVEYDGRGYRIVTAFPTEALRTILTFLVTSPHKYIGDRWPSLNLWLDVKTGKFIFEDKA